MNVIPFSQLPLGIEIQSEREILFPCESGTSKILYIKGSYLGRKVKYYVFPKSDDTGGMRPLQSARPISHMSQAALGKRGREEPVDLDTARPRKRALRHGEVLDKVPEEMGHVYISARSEATRTETVGVIILKSENGERTVRIWADKFDYLNRLPEELILKILGWTQSSPRSLSEGLLTSVRQVSKRLMRLAQCHLATVINREHVALVKTLERFGHKRADRRAVTTAVKNRYARVAFAMGPYLRYANFHQISIDATYAEELARTCPSIEAVRIYQHKLTNSTLKALSKLPSLKRLYLGECDINSTAFRIIGKMPSLEWLVLRNTSQVPEKEWIHLQSIRELKFKDTICSLDVFVQSLKNLRRLSITKDTLISWLTNLTGSPVEEIISLSDFRLLFYILVNSNTFKEGTKIEEVTLELNLFPKIVMTRDPVTNVFS